MNKSKKNVDELKSIILDKIILFKDDIINMCECEESKQKINDNFNNI